MINDIVIILQELISKQEGEINVNWLPDTFCSQWTIKWNIDIIKVNSLWNRVVGDIMDKLNQVPNITLNKWDFINEWERVFITLKWL